MISKLIDMNCNLCGTCRDRQAAFLCFCSEAFICSECIGQHITSAPTLEHKLAPLTSTDLVSTMRTEAPSQPHSRSLTREVLTRELRRLADFSHTALSHLADAQLRWTKDLERVFTEKKSKLTTQVARLEKEMTLCAELDSPSALESVLGDRLRQLATEEEQLLSLTCEVKTLELRTLLDQALLFEADYCNASKPVPVLYKFFGGSNLVGVFDAHAENCLQPITASCKFFHNACWSVEPSGAVFVTGGSLTGKSRNEALEFNPTTGKVRELQPMQVARRSHASICTGKRFFVFGGIMDEERLSRCERYNSDSDVWTSTGSMNERRAYLGCCEWKGQVYVGGGCERSSIEIMPLDSEAFALVPLPQISLEDNCSMLGLDNYVIIFHGSYHGEVTKLQPPDQVTREKEICYGNSWSNCLPVCEGDNIFLLRSDSVFSYSLSSGSSTYVLHLAKASKRKEY